ncbi:MAG: flagellar biosynthetic protein FliR [Deltaproteobacteria bacterium]|nr:flagellar biosynthetic protein FliR [Deltaproteobacteria bacterium]
MTPLEAALEAELGRFLLALCRISGLLMTSPLLVGGAPRTVRAGLAFLLAAVAHGAMPAPAVPGPSLGMVVAAVPGEVLLGAAMGFVVRLAVGVAEIMGGSVSPLIGFGMAQVFDPSQGGMDTVVTTLVRSLALWVALLLGLHQLVLGAVIASFRVVPAGAVVSMGAAAPGLLEAASASLETGARLSIPLVAVLFIVQIALGFVTRAAPAMQIFSVGFAFTLVAGGVVLTLTIPDFTRELALSLGDVGPRLERLVVAAGGGT